MFALAAITDGLDGYIARSRRSITTFGKVMDPIADKLLIAAALITLVGLNRVAAWVAMVIIAREFAVSGLRVAAGQQGVVIPASPLGKLKTVVQVAAIFAVIATGDHAAWWAQVLLYIAVAVTRRLGRRLLPQLPPPDRGGARAARARARVALRGRRPEASPARARQRSASAARRSISSSRLVPRM